jgi:IS4 transposase
LNAIYGILNKVYIDVNLQAKPSANERKAFIDMFEKQEHETKTLFIADRGYPSWNMFAHFKYKKNADFLIRYPNSLSNLTKDLPMTQFDIDREITITTNTAYKKTNGYVFIQVKKNKMTNREYTNASSFIDWDYGMFEKLNLRIIRFELPSGDYETIITSLSRDKFPLAEIKKLYGMRWGIETSFRELKYIIGLTNLHCKREDFVVQEIYARLTMYNFCERILQYTVIEQDENRNYQYQVNFTMAMQICIDFFKSLVGEIDFYDLVCKYIVPIRPGRADKRKLRPKTFVSFIYRVV